MQSITSVDALHQAIARLENRRNQQEREIALRYDDFKESLHPSHIIKSLFRGLLRPQGIQHRILIGAIGTIAGYLSRRLLFRSRSGFLK